MRPFEPSLSTGGATGGDPRNFRLWLQLWLRLWLRVHNSTVRNRFVSCRPVHCFSRATNSSRPVPPKHTRSPQSELAIEGIVHVAIPSFGVYGVRMAKQVRRSEPFLAITQFIEVETDWRGIGEGVAEVARRGHDFHRVPLGCADDA